MFSPETETGLKLLTTALMKRAMSDVQRAWKIRDEKPPLQGLVKQGVVGEDLWENLTRAEQELDVEIQDVSFTGRQTFFFDFLGFLSTLTINLFYHWLI